MLILVTLGSLLFVPTRVNPSYAETSTKSMHFYLHYTSAASVGGVSTNYLMNTNRAFQNVKNSDVKKIGQPKIQVDWYLYPSFAGPVTFTGSWQVIIFVNASALHPANWNLEFWEKTPQGTVIWDSGALSPSVQGGPSGNPGSVDVPVFGYTLTSDLTHTFNPGNTLELEVTVNTGSTVEARVWYDSVLYPSQAIFPSTDFAKPVSIRTLDANLTAKEVFFTFWNEQQRKVVISADVTDPFGGYDISRVTATITDSANRTVLVDQPMNRISGDPFSFTSTYETVWSYPADALQGKYRVDVEVIDNNGKYNFESFGNFGPYVESSSKFFSIGIQYPVHFIIQDNRHQPLASASLTVLSAGLPVAAGTTDSTGMLTLTLFTGNFEVQVKWYNILVADERISFTNESTYTITTAVYYPEFRFVSNAGNPLNGAMVFVAAPNGTNIRLPYLSDANGAISFRQQPGGEYGLLTFWHGVLVADAKVNVTADGPYTIRTQVFRLTVNVTDNSEAPLENTQIVVSSSTGRVLDFGITGKLGQVSFNLPADDYKVTTYFFGSYWLNFISNTTTLTVPVRADRLIAVSLSNIPPPVYTTIGFWLIVIPLVIVILLAVILLRRRKRAR